MKTFIASTLFLALAACSGQSNNQADANFAQQMIPHHQQAIRMSEFAGENAGPEVRKLAARIEAAQAPEIAQMKGWLAAWDLPVQADHGMTHDVPGMMSEDQMDDLKAAKAKAYDRLWLQMMIEHHEGAVAMAKTEIEDGKYPDAIRLARAIVKTQTAEIAEMQRMLK